MNCVYFQERKDGPEDKAGRRIHHCKLFEQCTLTGENGEVPSCQGCGSKLLITDPEFPSKFRDNLFIIDRAGQQTHAIRNLISGGDAFLVCGGPSARSLPMELLTQRGIFSMGVNNVAGKYHTSAFVCSDPPSKFHDGIWLDPWMMKFVPTPKLHSGRGSLRRKVGEEFERLTIRGQPISTPDCPNVWGFLRRSWFLPDDTFFTDEGAAWGNLDAGIQRTGGVKTVCTPLLALRLLYYLGARRIFLVGVDFWMDPGKPLRENYSFAEQRDAGAIASNNRQFRIVAQWFDRMKENGVFDRFGLQIYNCNQLSNLRTFEYVPFETAVRLALKEFPKEPFDLRDWYKK